MSVFRVGGRACSTSLKRLRSIIPVAIVGSDTFYAIFSDILGAPAPLPRALTHAHVRACLSTGFIGYWLAPFCAVVLTEHVVFRRGRWAAYDVARAWDRAGHPNLPRGYAAVCTFAATVGFIVLCMQKQWWTGPLARTGTGDVGMLLGFVVGVLVYLCARWLELRWGRAGARGAGGF